ncbi:DUF4395 family protein [Kaarinaea lacus]
MSKSINSYESDTQFDQELSVLRRRLETQSFLNQSCETLNELKHWWRFTPALNWVMTLTGILLASPEILFVQAALMGLAVILPSHPFDWFYNYGVRYLTGTAPLPKSGQRRRVMFTTACVMLSSLGVWFLLGYNMVAYIQGGIMTVLAGLLVVFNLCLLAEVLVKFFGMPTR